MRQQTRHVLIAVLCLCLLGQVFITPAVARTAQTETHAKWPGSAIFVDSGNDSDGEGVFQQGGDAILDAAGSAVRAADSVTRQVTGTEQSTANTYARETAAAIEDNDAALRELANEEFDADGSDQVVRVTFTAENGDTATRYLIANAKDGQWEDGPRVITSEKFDEMDSSVDHWVTLDPYASRHISDDIEQLATASEDGDRPSKAILKVRLAASYGSGVESDLLDDE
ncbi:hypothetical protein [Haloarcula nitratireducens]|uniref:Uncharacterized protein n=1 Tax=Haloarcula nitratireducens TaxID=2487749 RepID=A0AAW4PH62_9EURY|nr:hypothetical protein [Halomicroarcula nitratireducens]MBX0297801.1 hypothetical protein [Halomicroarcula nitratireducens]